MQITSQNNGNYIKFHGFESTDSFADQLNCIARHFKLSQTDLMNTKY